MKIAFFGTSDRSIPILNALKNSNFELSLCVTKTDVKIGRNQLLKPTGVKKWCEDNRVQYVTIDSLKGESTGQIAGLLSENNIELGVVADFSFIIPERILATPTHGIVNIHFSLLPKYRGASPVQFAILNLDKKTGITYLLTTSKMDAGPILSQIEYKLDGSETSGELYEKLFVLAAKKLPEILEKYVEGDIKPKEQNEEEATYTFSHSHPEHTFIYKDDAKIDWSITPSLIDATVRAYNPWPIAWTTLDEIKAWAKQRQPSKSETPKQKLKVKIYETKLIDNELVIKTVQVEGKNKISWKEFKNGYLSNN